MKGGITVSGGSDEAADGDETALLKVDSAVGVDLSGGRVTSQMESWIEEWSLEGIILSVKSHFLGR